MKAVKSTKTIFIVELEPDEAVWLKGILQNSLNGISTEQETSEESKFRIGLFQLLMSVLTK